MMDWRLVEAAVVDSPLMSLSRFRDGVRRVRKEVGGGVEVVLGESRVMARTGSALATER